MAKIKDKNVAENKVNDAANSGLMGKVKTGLKYAFIAGGAAVGYSVVRDCLKDDKNLVVKNDGDSFSVGYEDNPTAEGDTGVASMSTKETERMVKNANIRNSFTFDSNVSEPQQTNTTERDTGEDLYEQPQTDTNEVNIEY